MRLDDELVAPLRAVAERFALPKVRALHLPPREAVQAARRAGRGEFCLLELDDGTPGAAYVMLDDDHEALLLGHGAEALAGADALALAASFGAARGARRVVAWAALGGLVISLGWGYAAVPWVGAALAASGLGLAWLGRRDRSPKALCTSSL